jgi:hypothetical protein
VAVVQRDLGSIEVNSVLVTFDQKGTIFNFRIEASEGDRRRVIRPQIVGKMLPAVLAIDVIAAIEAKF